MKTHHIRLVLALDNLHLSNLLYLAAEVADLVDYFKINDALDRYGIQVLKELAKIKPVFADPKIYDTPRTTHNRVQVYADAGAAFVTVHAVEKVLQAAAKVNLGNTELVAVTQLTSEKDHRRNGRTQNIVDEKAALAYRFGIKNITCSANDARFTTVPRDDMHYFIPGVRPDWAHQSPGQERTTEPREAVLMLGKNFSLILGTSVTDACNYGSTPRDALIRIRAEIQSLL